jgi:hypothetical protein
MFAPPPPLQPQRPVAPKAPAVAAPVSPSPPVVAKPPAPPPKPPTAPAPPRPAAATPAPPAKPPEIPVARPAIDPLANRVTTSAPAPEATVVSKPAANRPAAAAASGIQGIEVVVGPRTVKLARGEFVVGRALDAPIRLDTNDREVSRAHAKLTVRLEGVEIEDRSQNGTFVNNVRISSRSPLQDGDQIRCGSMTLTIRFVR